MTNDPIAEAVAKERARLRTEVLKLMTFQQLEGEVFSTKIVVELISRDSVLALLRD